MDQAKEVFGIRVFTINKWKQKLNKTGSPENELRRLILRKLEPEKLEAYVGKGSAPLVPPPNERGLFFARC